MEHFVREDGGWLLTEANDPDEVLSLPTVGCEVPLAQVYRKVVFPT